jgi:hypothetical protein
MEHKNLDSSFIKDFINNLDNNNYNIDDLQKILKNLNENNSIKESNNNYVNIKREKFFLDIPKLPSLNSDKIKINKNLNNNKKIKKNNNKLNNKKQLIIDQNFINNITNKFILAYPQYIEYHQEINDILIEYFIKKYPIEN